MSNVDTLLSMMVSQRMELDKAIGLRAAEIVRAWLLKTGRAHVCIDEENPSLALTDDRSGLLDCRAESQRHGFDFDGLNDAIGNLPPEVIRWEQNPSGHTVILADVNTYLERTYNDRNPHLIASRNAWEEQ